jgi:hypothetical protein
MTGGVASGRVTFKDGSVVLGTATLSGGRATLVTSALGAGAHRMSAVYSGAGRLAGSTSAPVSLTVAAPSHRAASQTTLTASASAVGSGKPVTFTATVRPVSGSGTLTGTVTFRDGTTVLGTIALSNGSARLALSTLRNGSHSVTATYNGDGRFNTSASAVRSLTVSPVLTPTTGTSMVATELTVPATPVSARRPVTLRVVVRPLNGSPVAPTGRVTFRKGSLVLGIVTLDRTGAATFTLPAGRLAPGQYMISAYYDGDSRYAGDGGADILALSA